MDHFNLEEQYEFYLNISGLNEKALLPVQAQETKRAFMAGCGQMLNILTEGLNGMTEEQATPKLESLFIQVSKYWENEMAKAGETDIKGFDALDALHDGSRRGH